MPQRTKVFAQIQKCQLTFIGQNRGKRMKNTYAVIAAVATLATSGAALAQEVSVTTTWAYESAYVFRGVQFAENSFQPDINVSYGGWNAGAWVNLPIGDDNVSYGDELDLYGSYSFQATELIGASVGITYYAFPDASSGFFDAYEEDSGDGANTVEIFASASFAAPFGPSLTVYHDFMFDTVTFEGSASASYALADGLSASFTPTVGHVIDDSVGMDYTYYSVSADLSKSFSDTASGSIGVRWYGSSEETLFDEPLQGTFRQNLFAFGINFTAGF